MFLAKYAWLTMRRRPVLVHFEVTHRCNARCAFCDFWRTDPSARERELRSYVDAARFFNPMLVTFTGGEPTLRSDLEDLISAVAGSLDWRYIILLTHGATLTPARARALWDAGVDQFNISLDYLDGRHDQARGIPGLTTKILTTVSDMRSGGIDGIRFNTVIKNDNLDQILPIIRQADELGVGVNLSVYTAAKNGNASWVLGERELDDVDGVVRDVLAYKRSRRGVITNSDYYLEQIPRYVRGQMREPCRSGIRTIHIDPAGFVKRCPDFPTDFHWRDFAGYRPIHCNACYYACRGEAQAPLRWSRVRDVLA